MGWGRMDEHEELNELSGRVLHVIYANEENGYAVLRLDTLDGGVTTVVGTLPEGWTAAYLNLEDDNGCVYSSEVFFN